MLPTGAFSSASYRERAGSDPAAEIVVVDDGSPDATSEVAADYAQVHCVRRENPGLAQARNAGFRVARSDYLIFSGCGFLGGLIWYARGQLVVLPWKYRRRIFRKIRARFKTDTPRYRFI